MGIWRFDAVPRPARAHLDALCAAPLVSDSADCRDINMRCVSSCYSTVYGIEC